ncbi:MFS transporter [Aurantimonas sp. MSK8Z-1]|uniref:MFS transporter n=1 Tax=Mangrovibrevibacter kandeliae TaxID=2968473 RepID=UPI00211881EB|nr:MFS transporter [Aurantimonas sp. MSK8Z-1]MCW4113367.1 MFS transporter [Aurantimonas sp. MSK8Z-1]
MSTIGAPLWPAPRGLIPGLGIVQIFAWGSSYYLPAVLSASIADDTGWPLAWVVGGLSVGLLASGLLAPAVGARIKRHGGRPVMAAGALGLAAGLVALALAPTLPLFYLAWLLLGCGMSASLYDAAFSTLGGIYGAESRPAIGRLTLFGGFASTVCWPLSSLLAAHLGWRGACIAYAGIQLLVALPLILLALPRQARPGGAAGQRAKPLPDRRFTGPLRRAFLLMSLIVPIGGVVASLMSVYLIALLEARGVSHALAVSFGTLIGPAQVGARIIELSFGTRYHPIWTLAAASALVACGVSLLAAGPFVAAVALVLFGAGNGIWSIARGTLPLALFGPDLYPSVMGRLALPSFLASAATPALGGVIVGSLGAAGIFAVQIVLALVNLGLIALLWRDATSVE